MGFDINGLRLLINAKQLNVNFQKSLTIGRQEMHISKKDFHKLLTETTLKKIELDKYYESFFKLLGAETTHSLDASQYEGATIVHDMNLPLPDQYKNKYSLVIDGGSLEHIFNFPVAIKNCMELIEMNGYYIGITPANNFFGHGFYQFSPELYFRIFSESNGFKVLKMYFYIDKRNGKTPIFEVIDPKDAGERVTLQNSEPSYLFVIAQKIEEKEIFNKSPQQSDYERILWNGLSNKKNNPTTRSINFIRQLIPVSLKDMAYLIKVRIKYRYSLLFQPIGISNSEFIKKTKEQIAKIRT